MLARKTILTQFTNKGQVYEFLYLPSWLISKVVRYIYTFPLGKNFRQIDEIFTGREGIFIPSR